MNGFFLLNKSKNITSHQAITELKEKLKIDKIGHAGTLDPLATGLLIVCVNKATSLQEIVAGQEKEYVATAKIGVATDTGDIAGAIISENNQKITEETIVTVLQNFPKKYFQTVPKYSATKIKGRKLYEYARKNKPIELPKKEVEIKELKLLNFDFEKQIFQFKVLVSKGTYIRSLIEDVAKKAGTIATMQELTRTKQGDFLLEEAKPITQLTKQDLKPIITVLEDYPKIEIDATKIVNGQLIPNLYSSEKILLIDKNHTPLAIYQVYHKDRKLMKPWKMLI